MTSGRKILELRKIEYITNQNLGYTSKAGGQGKFMSASVKTKSRYLC